MKKCKSLLLINAFTYCLILIAITENDYNKYAENVADFLFVTFGVLYGLLVFSGKEVLSKIYEDMPSKHYYTASMALTFGEIVLLASQGWYWLSSCVFLHVVVMSMAKTAYEKCYNK